MLRDSPSDFFAVPVALAQLFFYIILILKKEKPYR